MKNIKIKKQQCIEQAINAKILSANNHLNQIIDNGIYYDKPMNLLLDGINWKEKILDRFAQIFIYFLSIPLILLISPISLLINYIDIKNKKKELSREIKLLELQEIKDIDYEYKSLGELWYLYGMNNSKYSEQEKINLLEIWITILFGEEVTENLDINSQLKKIKVNNIETNKPYYNGVEGAAHYCFQAPIITLLDELSKK